MAMTGSDPADCRVRSWQPGAVRMLQVPPTSVVGGRQLHNNADRGTNGHLLTADLAATQVAIGHNAPRLQRPLTAAYAYAATCTDYQSIKSFYEVLLQCNVYKARLHRAMQ